MPSPAALRWTPTRSSTAAMRLAVLVLLPALGCVLSSTPPSEDPEPCPEHPEPARDTVVKVDGGHFTLTLPEALGGVVVEGQQAPFGSYRRHWDGETFTVHDMWLTLPSIELPVPHLEHPGPLVIRQAIGGFSPEDVEALGYADTGRFDPETGVLTETLGLTVELPGVETTRVLLRKTEEGYDPEHGASLSFTGQGVITDGPLAGATLQVSSTSGKGADYSFEVCNETRISTGHATAATGCTVSPSSRATCRVSNLSGAGGVLVHCKEPGLATVTISYLDGRGRRSASRTVRCT